MQCFVFLRADVATPKCSGQYTYASGSVPGGVQKAANQPQSDNALIGWRGIGARQGMHRLHQLRNRFIICRRDFGPQGRRDSERECRSSSSAQLRVRVAPESFECQLHSPIDGSRKSGEVNGTLRACSHHSNAQRPRTPAESPSRADGGVGAYLLPSRCRVEQLERHIASPNRDWRSGACVRVHSAKAHHSRRRADRPRTLDASARDAPSARAPPSSAKELCGPCLLFRIAPGSLRARSRCPSPAAAYTLILSAHFHT
jgi:hypothetical protein